MKWFIWLLVLAVLGTGVYAYKNNPAECAKLGSDLKADFPQIAADVTTIFTSNTEAPDVAPSKTAPSPAKGAKPSDTEKPQATPSTSDSTPGTSGTSASGASASGTSPATAASAPAGWSPPAKIPAQANWTWTTSQGTFTFVHILKVEADRVTILHMQGQAVVPIHELPPDLQKQLNYSPAAALAAAAERSKHDGPAIAAAQQPVMQPMATAQPELAQAAPMPRFTETTNYSDALAEARRTKRKVLLHFTGSDWCYYCKMLDQEVLRGRNSGNMRRPNISR